MLTAAWFLGRMGSSVTFFLTLFVVGRNHVLSLISAGESVDILGWLALIGALAAIFGATVVRENLLIRVDPVVGAILMGMSPILCILFAVSGGYTFGAYQSWGMVILLGLGILPLMIAALLGFLGRGEAAQTQTPPTYTS